MDVKKYNFKKMCAFKKPLIKNVIHDISKNVCFEKTVSKKCN